MCDYLFALGIGVAAIMVGNACGAVEERATNDATFTEDSAVAVDGGQEDEDGSVSPLDAALPTDADPDGGDGVADCELMLAFHAHDFDDPLTFEGDLYLIRLDGEPAIQIVDHPGANAADPEWSPDGTRLAFTSNAEGQHEVYVYDLNTEQIERLTAHAGASSTRDRRPFWSPDGSRIVFERQADGERDLWLMNADGSNQTQLTHRGDVESDFIFDPWHPTGDRVLFVVTEVDGTTVTSDIFSVTVPGGTVVNLTNDDALSQGPAWSSDGSRILHSSGDVSTSQIQVMEADGSNAREIGTASGSEPRWSPDDTRIAFRCGDGICVMNEDGSGFFVLSDEDGLANPRWSPDGAFIAYRRFPGEGHGLFVIPSEGGEAEHIESSLFRHTQPAWRPCPD